MRSMQFLLIVLLLTVSVGHAQDEPVVVLESGWKYFREPPKKGETGGAIPAAAMVDHNRNFQRNARENQMQQRSVIDPNEQTIDGRSAQLERMSQEARAPNLDAKLGFSYFANFRNDTGKKIDIIFWEYRFTEIAAPANVVSRHFLCVASLDPGGKRDLVATSALGPSDVISTESLTKPNQKLFDEKIFVNRIEFADGAILQRHGWKYADLEKAIKRVASTPWGKEVCRIL